MANYNPRPPIEIRLWGRMDTSDPQSCWDFPNNPGKYGRIFFRGSAMDAHRVAWIVTNGDVPVGKEVRHKCDNKSCVNPAHLETGTRKDNVRDAFTRLPRCGRAKLTHEQVRAIRSSNEPYPVLAKRYGVHRETIGRVRRRENVYDGLMSAAD